MGRVTDKVAIITGAASGLGRASALLLAKEGAKVAVSDVDEVNGREVAEIIKREGDQAVFMKHDVSSESDWEKVIKETLEQFGRLDIMVNCAGVFLTKSIEDTTLEEWRWLLSINLDGVFLGTKYAIGAMKKSGGGSIINISSVAGFIGTPDSSAYTASKGGVRLFTKTAACECSRAGYDYNIRVNSVHPGVIETPMMAPFLEDENRRKGAEDLSLLGHCGTPEDVAFGVLYLASDESKFVTGSELVIDGGWTAH